MANAPFYYTEVKGDFVFRAKVRPNHRYTYDACALMVIRDEKMWAKAAFEKTDFGTKAAVCVVTNQVSDDANGLLFVFVLTFVTAGAVIVDSK